VDASREPSEQAFAKENWMSETENRRAGLIDDRGTGEPLIPDSPDVPVGAGDQDSESAHTAIHRPASTLEFPPKGKIPKFTASLLDDIESAPRLEEIERINAGAKGAARTPLMTVIVAVLAKHGGSMLLEDLTAEVTRCWNRPLPGSPYSAVEFIYSVVRSSDAVTVKH
jgi:hypothetical protein